MEYIHKTISLEKHKARIPINIPPCDTSLLCLYRDSMDGAWGMLPQTIVIPENIARYISAQCDVDVNIPLKAENTIRALSIATSYMVITKTSILNTPPMRSTIKFTMSLTELCLSIPSAQTMRNQLNA